MVRAPPPFPQHRASLLEFRSLFGVLRRAPRLVHQVEQRVKVGGVELPVVRTATRNRFKTF